MVASIFVASSFLIAATSCVHAQPDRTWSAPSGSGGAPVTADAFFLDSRIVTEVCENKPPCQVTILDLRDLRPILSVPDASRAQLAGLAGFLHRGPPGFLIEDDQLLSDSSLASAGPLGVRPVLLSRDGTLVGTGEGDRWCIRPAIAGAACTVTGAGRLLGLDPSLLVISVPGSPGVRYGGESVELHAPGGALIAGLSFPPCHVTESPFYPGKVTVTALGVLVDTCNRFTMFDRNGKVIWHRSSDPGSAHHVLPSRDGKRLLFTEDRHQVWFGRRVKELAQALPSMGERGPDMDSNLLLLRVVDGTNGRVCYRRNVNFTEGAAIPLADLSPDGRQILIGWQGKLTLTPFPDSCAQP